MKMKVSSGGMPIGSHKAKFSGVEEINNDYGEGLEWHFGDFKTITQRTPTLRNRCGKMLGGLTGKALTNNQEIDPQEFIGKDYLVIIAPNEQGQGRIDTIVPL